MTTVNDPIKAKLSAFGKSVAAAEYDLASPYPMPGEDILDGIGQLVSQLGDSGSTSLRREVDRDLADKLLSYSRRAAVRALRERTESRLLDGMTASLLDDDLLDIRDVFRAWTLHYDACQRLGVSFDLLFKAATVCATSARRRQLENQFLSGPAYTKSIKTMKFAYSEDATGPIYIDQLFG